MVKKISLPGSKGEKKKEKNVFFNVFFRNVEIYLILSGRETTTKKK